MVRLPVLIAGVLLILSANKTLFGQAASPGSANGLAQPSSSTPIGDLVPCIQKPKDDWVLRGIQQQTPPSPRLSQNQVMALIDTAVAAAKAAGMSTTAFQSTLSGNANEYAELPYKTAVTRIVNDATTAITASTDAQATSTVKTAAITAVKSAFPASTPPYQLPNDVQCSFSLMQWKETSDTFGRRIANQYVALQVTVRNSNPKNEFLIHDVHVAVDTGMGLDYFDRFSGTRDKLVVRAVAQRGQFEDRRNLIFNSLGLVGAVASFPTGVTSGEFSSAVAVFTGQLVPGLSNVVFPDHTVQQINNINDLGFSASSSSKMVVPIQGSVPFVTYIAERPLEQLPFAWCGKVKHGDNYHNESCDIPFGNPPGVKDWDESETLKELHYKKWRGAALRILSNNTYVVVSGMHIQETDSSALISHLNCPTIFGGHVDLSQLTNGQFVCTVTGNGLGSVHSVELQLNSNKVSGTIKPSTDGTSAQILFAASDLATLAGAYELYFVDASGNATDAQNSMLLSEQPVIIGAQPSKDSPATVITLTGTNLTTLDSVSVVSGTPGSTTTCTQTTTPATSSTWSCNPNPALTSGTYSLQYTVKNIPSYTANVRI